jgi:hypothetical protein
MAVALLSGVGTASMRLIIDRNFSGQPDKNERNGAPHVNVFELAFY